MGTRIIHWFRGSILSRLICEVPPEVAACEFDCRRTDCRQDEWVSCPNRRQVERGAG